MQRLLSYAQAFEEAHCARFVDVRTLDIVENMIISEFLAANLRASYVRYVTVSKMMMHPGVVVPLLVKLGGSALAAKTLGIVHLGDRVLYISHEDDALLIIQTAEVFVKNDYRPDHSRRKSPTDTPKPSMTCSRLIYETIQRAVSNLYALS